MMTWGGGHAGEGRCAATCCQARRSGSAGASAVMPERPMSCRCVGQSSARTRLALLNRSATNSQQRESFMATAKAVSDLLFPARLSMHPGTFLSVAGRLVVVYFSPNIGTRRPGMAADKLDMLASSAFEFCPRRRSLCTADLNVHKPPSFDSLTGYPPRALYRWFQPVSGPSGCAPRACPSRARSGGRCCASSATASRTARSCRRGDRPGMGKVVHT